MKSFTNAAGIGLVLFIAAACGNGVTGGQIAAWNRGKLTVQQAVTIDDGGAAQYSSQFRAAFQKMPTDAGVFTGSCLITAEGNCTASDCWQSASSAESLSIEGDVAAGTISIEGTLLDGGLSSSAITDGGSFRYVVDAPTQLFSGGERLSFSGAGDAVPPFLNHSLITPSVLTPTAPTPPCPNFDCGRVSTNSPLTIAWKGGPWGTATILVSSSDDVSGQIVCRVAASVGSVTLSPTLLSVLGGRGEIRLLNTGFSEFEAGDFWLTANATNDFFIGTATF